MLAQERRQRQDSALIGSLLLLLFAPPAFPPPSWLLLLLHGWLLLLAPPSLSLHLEMLFCISIAPPRAGENADIVHEEERRRVRARTGCPFDPAEQRPAELIVDHQGGHRRRPIQDEHDLGWGGGGGVGQQMR